MTERAEYRAVIKESGDGEPFIVFEPLSDNMPSLKKAFVSLDLKPGTTYEEAMELERALDQYVAGLAITRF